MYKQLRNKQFLVNVPGRWALVDGHGDLNNVVSRADLVVYEDLLKQVERAFDANAYRFIGLAEFLAPLGIV